MKIQTIHAVALTLAGALAVATPALAKSVHETAGATAAQSAQPVHPGSPDEPMGYFAPGSTGYGRWAYNPEQPTDPDPRIGGSLKISTDR